MSNPQGFVPVSELAGAASDQVSWRVNLPEFVPTERIGVNVQRIGRIASIGGVGHVYIRSEAGDTTQYHASAVGVDGQGTAVAGTSITVEKADMHEAGPATPPSQAEKFFPDHFRRDVRIVLNTAEMQQQILQAKAGGNLRDSAAWSTFINRSLKRGIREAVVKTQLADIMAFRYTFLGLMGTAQLLYATSNKLLVVHAVTLAQDSLFFNFMDHVRGKIRPDLTLDNKRRLSFVPLLNIDRVAAAVGMSHVLKLAKAV